jgi:hypothetical protein
MAQLFDRSIDFAFFDLAIFIILVARTQSLPRQLTFKQVQDNISGPLKVVPSALFNTQVCVGRCISCRTSQALLIAIGDVFISGNIFPAFSETEINQIYGLGIVLHSNEDILGF